MTVSPMMDAGTTNMAMSQINFIEFVVAPLYVNFARMFPETAEMVGHLIGNRMHYQAGLFNRKP
jgi:cAMP-specific phosphodiesterase 4